MNLTSFFHSQQRPNPTLALVAYATTIGFLAICIMFFSNEITAQAEPTDGANRTSSIRPDFNGDGYADLAVGATGERFGDANAAGAITILYGDPEQTPKKSSFIHQGMPYVSDSDEYRDHFGARSTFGDFNGDGFDDLVVSAPDEDIGVIPDAGKVWVFSGSPEGVGATEIGKTFHQESLSGFGENEAGDRWGAMLSVGDFNGDGYEDLVVGAPEKGKNGKTDVGKLSILFGSPSGLTTSQSQHIDQETRGVPDSGEENDKWGWALASGDFNNDGFADLAVGAPGEKYGQFLEVGAVTLMYGSPSGITTDNTVRLHQNTPHVPDRNEAYDQWGAVLTTGDFNNDGFTDLAIGAPNESSGKREQTGSVTIMFGTEQGLSVQKSSRLHQGSSNISGRNEEGDRWGSVLTSGDFNGDKYWDLAIGAPAESLDNVQRAGAVTLVFGNANGISGKGSITIDQDTEGFQIGAEPADHWGDALAALDMNGDGKSELVVAASGESLGTQFDTGLLTLFWGTEAGVDLNLFLTLDQDTINVPNENKSLDYWGRLGTTSQLDLERPPWGLTTTTGVTTVVLAKTQNGYIVRSPCGNAVPVIGGTLVTDVQIAIDPGHGGVDGGAYYAGIREHAINMDVAEAFLEELAKRDITSFLIRTKNYHIPLSSRGLYADHLQTAGMVSIHHNAPMIAPSSHPGAETFVQSNSVKSARLGTLVYEAVYEALDIFTWVSWTSQYDAGIIRVLNNRGTDTYGMMSRPKTPTTLIELAYLANPSEARLLKSPEYLPAVSTALADAVEEFLQSPSIGTYPTTVRNFTAADAPGYNVCRDPELNGPIIFNFPPMEELIEKGIIGE
ncbi:MAG: N-acetylmuramoyl-L-alanine amidase [Acidimicrobiales bacterium]|nr:N-acetylmuramoyl-L-alanine amidase [Acidimicrobiales bacterium]